MEDQTNPGPGFETIISTNKTNTDKSQKQGNIKRKITPCKNDKPQKLKPKPLENNEKSKNVKKENEKRANIDGDSDDDDKDDSDDSETEDDADEEDVVIDEADYALLLNQLFPSKFSKKKADKFKQQPQQQGKKYKTKSKEVTKVKDVKKPENTIITRSNAKSKIHDDDDEDYEPSSSSSSSSSCSSSLSDYEEELAELFSGKGMQKFNIIFTINENDYEDEDSDEDSEDSDDSDDDYLNEDDFKNYTDDDYKRDLKLLDNFSEMNEKLKNEHKTSAILNILSDEATQIKKSVERFKKKSEKEDKRLNMKKFKKVSGNKRYNENTFFGNRSIEQQLEIIKKLEEINSITTIDMPYKFKLLEIDIPIQLKSCAMKKIEMIKHMDQSMGEYYKLKNWIDTFMEIPFGKYNKLQVSIDDGIDKCRQFMTDAKNTLDNVVFGLDDAKMQIIQMIGTWISNPNAIGSAIAIQGPPGTGKTTLVKDGISKILGREFAFIALGGATDSSYLEGHGYTYEGSKWGKIVDILVQCKSMNPIIYFDELDKISDTPKGEEIIGILTHLTDTTQNSNFHDKYFSEIDFDLSKCLFIFSYNDESKINPILKDRMYRIYTQGYDKFQKQIIASDYLIPTIRETIKFNENDIIIDNTIIDYINTNYVENEKGVRNMKRCFEIIYTKLNLYRFIDSDSPFFDEQVTQYKIQPTKKKLKIEFPLTLTVELVDKLLKRNKLQDGYPHLYL